MKGGRQPHGFTIIEIMIFLAVSGIIFFSAMTLMSGSQNKTEFSTAIAQITSQLQSVVGNVANGYYLSQQNFTCLANPDGGSGSPSLSFTSTSTGPSRGTNVGCTFIGEVIQFDPLLPGLSYQEYVVYPVVGNQYYPPTNSPGPTNANVDNLTQAAPVAMYDSTDDPVKASTINSEIDTTQVLLYGITIHPNGIGYVDSSIVINSSNSCPIKAVNLECIGAIGFFTTFSGSQSAQIIPIPGSKPGQDQSTMVKEINSLKNGLGNVITGIADSDDTVSNPDGGVRICFDSGTSNQSGLITIGGINSPTAVTLQKFSQKGCI
ncbi:MAG TPA: type II secretion system protein [Candidatus Saccharimonadales bacterium]|jgi:type II secretory pathway pseudopilin PulG|nr:type II secretion system protein [Candidatus Saccharimonadales bacterium]